ncbi:MAG: IclR family transcriptional regulator [Candidatus Dormibacteraeota bacterium]|nr:IclR family transcriptional regulator [Candidatus Dormibacteraeota bacterium]
MRDSDGLSSVGHALQVLVLLRDRQAVRVHEVSEALGLARSTAHRLLTTLQTHGFVVQEGNRGAYRVGPALVDVGLAALQGLDVRRAAHPILVSLSRQLRETVSLVVLEDDRIRFLDSIESTEDVRVASRMGVSLPAHTSAGGKALLADLRVDELRRIYPDEPLQTPTPRSIPSRSQLERELEMVNARGYATNFEESTPEISAVGLLIPNRNGLPAAALAVSAPASRLPEDRVPAIVAEIRRAAAEIDQTLRAIR